MDEKVRRRIRLDIDKCCLKGTKINVIDDYNIRAFINGPDDTPYSRGTWEIAVSFPKNYPYRSPSLGFIDKIYHPNVDYSSGSICLNVLNEDWQPIYTLEHVIYTFIPQLLTYPNAEDPLNIESANLYKANIKQFNRHVKMKMFENNIKIMNK